jgi:hypothetical protein
MRYSPQEPVLNLTPTILSCHVFSLLAIDFQQESSYSNGMLRVIIAGAIVVVAAVLLLVGYNVLVIGTGLGGAVALLNRYWRQFAAEPVATQTLQFLAVVVTAVFLGWRAGWLRESGRY